MIAAVTSPENTHAAATQQEKKARIRRRRRRQIPSELLELILLHLPFKSVLRFSLVSKSWNSVIAGKWFAGRYGGWKMLVAKPHGGGHLRGASMSPLAGAGGAATPLAPPFEGRPHLVASCDELWCVQVNLSLILWAPPFATYRKLPGPRFPLWPKFPPWSGNFRYGLGFDPVNDDYKVLKICTCKLRTTDKVEAELYSLKSDTWKRIKPFPRRNVLSRYGISVSGMLHWLIDRDIRGKFVIISFDLSAEKYCTLALPEMGPINHNRSLDLTNLRGNLCLCANDLDIAQFVIWVRDGKMWAKEVEIRYGDVMPMNPSNCLRPFDYYDGDGNLVNAVICSNNSPQIFTYIKWDGGSEVEVKNVGHVFNGNAKISNSFTYIAKYSVVGYLARRPVLELD